MQTSNCSKGFFRTLFQTKLPLPKITSTLHNLESISDKPKMSKESARNAKSTAHTPTRERNCMLSEADSAEPNCDRRTWPGCSRVVPTVREAQQTSAAGRSEESINGLNWRRNPYLVPPINNYDYMNMQTCPQQFFHWNGAYSNPFFYHQMESAYSIYRNFSNCAVDPCSFSNMYFHRNDVRNRCSKRDYNSLRGTANCNTNLPVSVSKLRSWEIVDEGEHKEGFVFQLMSYNVLAQALLDEHPELYRRHNRRALEWHVRWRNLMREITDISPDILCMQEVQESHIPDYYSTLGQIGYTGIYKRRTSSLLVDGCAIYYKSERLNLVEYTTVEFFQPNVDVLNRHNVALIAKFAPKNNPKAEFVVATTHLLYNPKREDVRLAQMQVLLAEVERFAFKSVSQGDVHEYFPLLICGDFNLTPESVVYEFVRKGHLEYCSLEPRTLARNALNKMGNVLLPYFLGITDWCQHVDLVEERKKRLDVNREEEMRVIRLHHSSKTQPAADEETQSTASVHNSTGTLRHNFAFQSAYKHFTNDDSEGSTFQNRWITVDYVFYSGKRQNGDVCEDKLCLLERYVLPTKTQLKNVNIPNMEQGSDHLPLVVKFRLEC